MQQKILIIGAGASGIAAAVRLLKHGFNNLLILEAENRIGGRVHTISFEGHTIELGAQWCHGEVNNVVYDMAKDLNILRPSFNDYVDNYYYDSSGKVVSKEITDELLSLAFQIFEDDKSMIKEKGTFGEYFSKTYNKEVNERFKGSDEFLKTAPKMSEWFHKFVISLESSPNWHDFSAAGHLQYETCEGNPLLHWQHFGFKTVFDIMTKQLPKYSNLHEKIIFNKKVSKIDWSRDEVTVTCIDGTKYQANNVITTVSLGVLKSTHKTLFSPQLPPRKLTAVESLSIGCVVKIFLKFPKRWWPQDCTGYSFLWSDEDIAKVAAEFPFGPTKSGKSWLVDVFGVYVVDSHPDVLLAWLVGECAPEVETMEDETLLKGCNFLLEKFLKGVVSVEPAEKVLCSKWAQNPNFRGCYSYRSVKTEENGILPKDLAEPIGNGGKGLVLFAGEATHDHYYSTVHGAIESGYREADRLIDMYKGEKPVYKSKI